MFTMKGVALVGRRSGIASRNVASIVVRENVATAERYRMRMPSQIESQMVCTNRLFSSARSTENGAENHADRAKAEKSGDTLSSMHNTSPSPVRPGRNSGQQQKVKTASIIDLSVRHDRRKKTKQNSPKENSSSSSSTLNNYRATETIKNRSSHREKGNNSAASTTERPKLKSTDPFRKVYVHPLSQIILQHLQNNRYDWVSKVGLDDGGLVLNRDGTFILRFPSPDGLGNDTVEATDIVDDSNAEKAKESINGSMRGGKLWTSYDPVEKKHWLAVQKGALAGQYMLQDNLKPAWHSSKHSTPEKIQKAVDEMILSIDKADMLALRDSAN